MFVALGTLQFLVRSKDGYVKDINVDTYSPIEFEHHVEQIVNCLNERYIFRRTKDGILKTTLLFK